MTKGSGNPGCFDGNGMKKGKVERLALPYLKFWEGSSSKYTPLVLGNAFCRTGAPNLRLQVQLSPSYGRCLGVIRPWQSLTPPRGTKRVVERRAVLGDFNELSSSEFPAVFPQGIGTTILFKNMVRMRDTGHLDGR